MYSDTGCTHTIPAGKVAVPKQSDEDIREGERIRASTRSYAQQESDAEYERKRDALLSEMQEGDRDAMNGVANAIVNKMRHRNLQDQLDILQRDHANKIDPAGASQRSMESKLDRLQRAQEQQQGMIQQQNQQREFDRIENQNKSSRTLNCRRDGLGGLDCKDRGW